MIPPKRGWGSLPKGFLRGTGLALVRKTRLKAGEKSGDLTFHRGGSFSLLFQRRGLRALVRSDLFPCNKRREGSKKIGVESFNFTFFRVGGIPHCSLRHHSTEILSLGKLKASLTFLSTKVAFYRVIQKSLTIFLWPSPLVGPFPGTLVLVPFQGGSLNILEVPKLRCFWHKSIHKPSSLYL